MVWREAASATEHAEEASLGRHDPVLDPAGFGRGFRARSPRAAIAALDYVPAAKVAFQARAAVLGTGPRGSTAAFRGRAGTATQIWYPSAGIDQKKGIDVGAYIWSEDLGRAFAEQPMPRRLADTLADTEVLHPASQMLRRGVSVAWPKIPFTGGAWAEWTSAARASDYPGCCSPETAPICSPASTCPTSTDGRRARSSPRTMRWVSIGERMKPGP